MKWMGKLKYLLTLLCVFFVKCSSRTVVQRKYSLQLCSDKVIQRFVIEQPSTCSTRSARVVTLRVNITTPFNRHVQQPAYTCRLKLSRHSCYKTFWGVKTCRKVTETFVSVDTASCVSMEETHQSRLGTLRPSSTDVLETNNRLVPVYYWLATTDIVVKNHVLAYTSVLGDTKTGSISHVLLNQLACIKVDKLLTCEEDGWRLVTSTVNVDTCKKPKTILDATLEIFALESGKIYKVNSANLVFSKLMRCEDSILSCLPGGTTSTWCTSTGFAITFPETYAHIPGAKSSESIVLPAEVRILEAAIATSSLASKLELELLENNIRTMFCQNSRATLVALLAAQKATPSAVLSLILGRKTQAVYKNGALYELQCQRTRAVLQPSLMVGDKIAKRPVFNCYLGSSTVTAQLTEEGFLSQSIDYSLHHMSKQTFILEGKLIVFENNTLSSERPAVERIKIDNKLTLQASNFTFSEDLTLSDLASVSSSDEVITNQALHNLIKLNTKYYQNQGIEIQQYIRKGHLWSADALEETLKAKVSTWSVIKQVLHALNAAWVIGTVIGVTVICYRLYRTYQQRKREGGLQGKVEAP